MTLKATTNITSENKSNTPIRDSATVKNIVDNPIMIARVVTIETLNPKLIKYHFSISMKSHRYKGYFIGKIKVFKNIFNEKPFYLNNLRTKQDFLRNRGNLEQ